MAIGKNMKRSVIKQNITARKIKLCFKMLLNIISRGDNRVTVLLTSLKALGTQQSPLGTLSIATFLSTT